VRIWKPLYQHCDDLFTSLDDPAVPADNNGTERDIRTLPAARSDGATHRVAGSAAAFARLKSVIVTGMKNRVRFIPNGIEVVRVQFRGEHLPLLLAATPATSKPRTGINRPQPGRRVDLPRRARPPLHRQPDGATMLVRAAHASSVTAHEEWKAAVRACHKHLDEVGDKLPEARTCTSCYSHHSSAPLRLKDQLRKRYAS
jgi:hypothetical protein